MKKVTILALHLGFGGIEKYISSLCKMLEEKYEVEIISTYKVLEQPAFEFDNKIKITYLIEDKPYINEMKESFKKYKLLKFLYYFLKNIKIFYCKKKLNIKAVKNIKSDIVITTRDFHSNLVSKYAPSNIIKIATEHNYHNDNKKYINNLIASINNFDYFVVVSKELQNFYKNKIGSTKCVFIPNVIEELYNKPCYNQNHNLIAVGRLSKEKGFNDLIDIIEKVKKDIPDIHLNLVGDGSEKENLKLKVKNLGLTNNITFCGFKAGKEKENVILKSSLYIMTSHTESFGIVLIEAMSYGLPCIAFDSSSGAREVIIQHELLIDNRDKEKISRKIVELLSNYEKLTALGKENYNYCQKFLLNNIKKEWFEILN